MISTENATESADTIETRTVSAIVAEAAPSVEPMGGNNHLHLGPQRPPTPPPLSSAAPRPAPWTFPIAEQMMRRARHFVVHSIQQVPDLGPPEVVEPWRPTHPPPASPPLREPPSETEVPPSRSYGQAAWASSPPSLQNWTHHPTPPSIRQPAQEYSLNTPRQEDLFSPSPEETPQDFCTNTR